MDQKLSFLAHLQWLKELYRAQPWIIGGDFNIIASLTEKKGGLRRLDRDSNLFRDIITQLQLVDMETANGIYTFTFNLDI